ncbi:M16 family metallopeptidase [Saccharothrix algeriensis]|uniref:Insulinase family protein n=1 Tax=Saccharothrix algeriensis TaxID=173560 RepID=A0A8T8HWM5_9PSEU|nr:insulinase family protein [Saccharothrix algeriensis]MBM7814481.1 putative Zn-dependent peptidase [Saccharothrix algeriensis]QTR02781.1 insulinase family protein [Saccharothrix algeriensis]
MFAVEMLDNGVRVVLDGSLGVRSVTTCAVVGAGSRTDDLDAPGLAHLLEHLVMAAPGAGGDSLSKWVDSAGGQSNASTSHESLFFWTRVPPEAAVECALRFDAALTAPAVTDALCAAESQVVVQELLAAADDPVDVAHEAFYGALFAGRPLARPVGGPVPFPEFGAADVLRAHRANLRSAPLGISLVGPAALLGEVLAALRAGGLAAVRREPRPVVPRGSGGAPGAGVAPGAEYAYLVAGGEGAGRADPRWAATEVLAAAVGGTPGSVLYERLRGELGVSYQLRSTHTAYDDVGVWSVVAGTPPAEVERVEKTIRDCLREVADGALGDAGFAAARRQAVGAVLLDHEDPVALAHLNSTWSAHHEPAEPPVDRARRLLADVAHADVRAAASRVLGSYTCVVAS